MALLWFAPPKVFFAARMAFWQSMHAAIPTPSPPMSRHSYTKKSTHNIRTPITTARGGNTCSTFRSRANRNGQPVALVRCDLSLVGFRRVTGVLPDEIVRTNTPPPGKEEETHDGAATDDSLASARDYPAWLTEAAPR